MQTTKEKSAIGNIAKKVIIAFGDAVIVAVAYGLSLWMRYDFRMNLIPEQMMAIWQRFVPMAMVITVVLFAALRMYRYIWHIVGLRDIITMLPKIMLTFAVTVIVSAATNLRLPISVYLISFLIQTVLFLCLRASLRVAAEIHGYLLNRVLTSPEHIMVIGGGASGRALIQEVGTNKEVQGKVCCVIDDNPEKLGKFVNGVQIVGGRDKIVEYVEKYQITQIIFAISSTTAQNKRDILNICAQTGVPTKTVPGMYQIVNGEVHVTDIQDVKIEDLLGRDPISLNLEPVRRIIEGKTVMVTGGGGSIGSELCRQIAHYAPKKLIILDIYENNAYDIQQELIRTYGEKLDLSVEIASVRDRVKIDEIFSTYRPELVFHAAAHKHVPLMEDCPSEAIKNNIFGTLNVADAAEKYGVQKFVMISTDKAVNPTNIMGATKRFCEMIMQSRSASKTEFCAVRFGNVLGSNGSVVPLFKRQIAQGGPVTITDKRITRFFMTIPEAVQLVLEAGSMAKQSQIFVLDMGEPVRILDLAENLIRLSGFKPYEDIQIEEIGLRPGEKLYEELLMASNDLSATENKKIFVEQQRSIKEDTLNESLQQLRTAIAEQRDNEQLTMLLRHVVPTYHAPSEINDSVSAYQTA